MNLKWLCAFILLSSGLAAQPGYRSWSQPEPVTRALVVGISDYRDEQIPDLHFAYRDAETFAAFLQSHSGGNIQKEDLRLLTNAEATYARLSTALDWLLTSSRKGDRIILYFAGYGDAGPGREGFPTFIYPYDAPLAPILPNSIQVDQVFRFIRESFPNGEIGYTVFTNLYPVTEPNRADTVLLLPHSLAAPRLSYSFSRNSIDTGEFPKISPGKARISWNHYLIDGLMGLADRNNNGHVSFREVRKFLNRVRPVESTCPGKLSIAVSDKRMEMSQANAELQVHLKDNHADLFPSIVHLETTRREDSIVNSAGEPTAALYRDFIIALKLGRFLPPEERNALDLYRALEGEPAIDALQGDLRRKLAAALQDETQQALNDYLSMDVRELRRREQEEGVYFRYGRYLETALSLLGQRHFLKAILQAKRYYFEGLGYRINATLQERPEDHLEALRLQKKALSYEPQAAFILNEIGINYSLLGKQDSAEYLFRKAVELAPNWSVPYANLGLLQLNGGDPVLGIDFAEQALRIGPESYFLWNTAGTLHAANNNFPAAQKALVLASQMAPDHPVPYYNLACMFSMQGQLEDAYAHLLKACDLGFRDMDFMQSDPALELLRADQVKWETLLGKCLPRLKGDNGNRQ